MGARASAWAVCVAALGALLAGCSTRPADPGILPIRDVELPELRPGATLRIRGAGFVPGPVDVTFRGTVAQPGGPPRPWSFVVHASATSDEQLVGQVPDAAVDVLQGTHGRFRGDVEVRFPPPPNAGLPTLVGLRGGLSVPMTSEVPASRETRAVREALADRFLARLGLAVALEDPRTPGGAPRILVRSVLPQAMEPLDELAPGDRIVAVDGIPAAALGDLAPDPAAEVVTLSLVEQGTERPFDVHVAQRDEAAGPPVGETLALFAVLAVLGLVLYMHFAGLSDSLARMLAFPLIRRRASPKPAASPAHGGGRLAGWAARGLAGLAGLAVAAAPIALFRAGRGLPVVGLWTAAVALLLVHRLAHTIGDLLRVRAGPGAGLARSFGAVAAAGAAALPLTASAALVLWNSAALTAGGAVAAQGPLPPGWATLHDPFALLLACLAFSCVGTGFVPGQPAWRTALDILTTGAACLLLAVTGFGGWNVGAFETTVFAGLPVAAWALEAKTAVLFGLVAWYGRRRWSRNLDPRQPGLAWIAAAPLALASAGLELFVPAAWGAAVLRPLAVGLLGALTLALWLGHRQRTAPAILEIRVDTE